MSRVGEVKLFQEIGKQELIYVQSTGFAGAYPSEAPTSQSLGDRGPIFRCSQEQIGNDFVSLEFSQANT